MEDHVALLEFENNPNIGLYIFANDKFALVGCEISSKKKKEIESILKVPVHKVTALGTELLGVFLAGNNDLLIIPDVYEYELKEFESIAKKYNLKLITLSHRLNTFGNNLCVTDSIIISNQHYNRDFLKKLEKETKLKTIKLKHDEFSSAGAVCRFVNGKIYASQELDETHAKEFIEQIGGVGTINSGGVFVSSGIVGNKNGILLGSQCSTIEIQNILEGLEFL